MQYYVFVGALAAFLIWILTPHYPAMLSGLLTTLLIVNTIHSCFCLESRQLATVIEIYEHSHKYLALSTTTVPVAVECDHICLVLDNITLDGDILTWRASGVRCLRRGFTPESGDAWWVTNERMGLALAFSHDSFCRFIYGNIFGYALWY